MIDRPWRDDETNQGNGRIHHTKRQGVDSWMNGTVRRTASRTHVGRAGRKCGFGEVSNVSMHLTKRLVFRGLRQIQHHREGLPKLSEKVRHSWNDPGVKPAYQFRMRRCIPSSWPEVEPTPKSRKKDLKIIVETRDRSQILCSIFLGGSLDKLSSSPDSLESYVTEASNGRCVPFSHHAVANGGWAELHGEAGPSKKAPEKNSGAL